MTAALGLRLCACIQAIPARAADDAKALLALHKSYVGWELGDDTLGSMRVVETLQKTGPDGKTKDVSEFREVRRGIVYHGNYSTKNGGRRDYGFTGSVFWSSNENGFTVPRSTKGACPNSRASSSSARRRPHSRRRSASAASLPAFRPSCCARAGRTG